MKLALLVMILAVKAPLPGVVTPSGNIHCFYVPGPPGHLLCDIHQAAYSKREQDGCMARSGLDWHGWEVYATRKTLPVCSGGILYNPTTQRPSYVTLAYGKTWRQKMFSCTSQPNGVNCSNTNGHGFFVSRQTWRVW